MPSLLVLVTFACVWLPVALAYPGQIVLAKQPTCGSYSSSTFVNANAGVSLSSIKTIVSFGDSYTDDGQHAGGTPAPAVASGTNPMYGGRISNGLMWTEDLAASISTSTIVKNYAVAGATVDHTLWPSRVNNSDFVGQAAIFLGQNNALDPASTLYTIFFGINDYAASIKDNVANLPAAAAQVVNQITKLVASPTNAKNFLVIGVEFDRATSQDFDNRIWNGLKNLRATAGINFAFVNWAELYDAIFASPSSFGYLYTTSCLVSETTTVGGCTDPDDYLYWIPAHPQYQTQRIEAQFSKAVFDNCGV